MEEYKVSPVQVARIMEKEIGCRYLLETRRHPIPKAEWFLIPELGTKPIKQMTYVYQKKEVIGLLAPFMIDTSAPRESIFQRSGLDRTIVREKYQSSSPRLYELYQKLDQFLEVTSKSTGIPISIARSKGWVSFKTEIPISTFCKNESSLIYAVQATADLILRFDEWSKE